MFFALKIKVGELSTNSAKALESSIHAKSFDLQMENIFNF